MILLSIMRMMSLASVNHENGGLQDSLFDVLNDSNGNLMESNEIIKNFVAIGDKEMDGNKGVNSGLKQAVKDKRNATFLIFIKTIPVTLAECFPANSSFDSRISAKVIIRGAS
jgi:hypothetical protein